MKTFGEVIAELRKERGLTQKSLAARLKKKDGRVVVLVQETAGRAAAMREQRVQHLLLDL
jgi:transcriptional regulator with XRE-family HTH domain